MNFKPLDDRVLVERIESPSQTKGGILIPDTAKEKPQEGRIIATGRGKVDDNGHKIPLTVKVGDHVLFGKWTGSDVELEGDEYLIMKESDILGILG